MLRFMAQVVLLAILYESHAWRQTVWHVVDEAVVVESKVWVLLGHCLPLVLLSQPCPQHRPANILPHHVQAWRDLMKDFIDRFPRWPLG
jgi:hypothetical protein